MENLKKYVILLIALISFGCNGIRRKETSNSSQISYLKDDRTGLCFAVVSSNVVNEKGLYTIRSITYVPCNKSIEELIKEDKK